jgi:hypothetical protein
MDGVFHPIRTIVQRESIVYPEILNEEQFPEGET